MLWFCNGARGPTYRLRGRGDGLGGRGDRLEGRGDGEMGRLYEIIANREVRESRDDIIRGVEWLEDSFIDDL